VGTVDEFPDEFVNDPGGEVQAILQKKVVMCS